MFPEIKLLMVELAKVSPFVFLLVVCLRVVWNRFEKKDAALTQQMQIGQDKLIALNERMIVAQNQNTQAYNQMSVSLDKNTQATIRLSDTIDDNQVAMMKRLDEIDTKTVKVQPLHRHKSSVTDTNSGLDRPGLDRPARA